MSNSRNKTPKKRGTRTLGREQSAHTVARVQRIIGHMTAREWTQELSAQLAAEWELSPSRVRQLAAEASRFVRSAIGNREDIRAFLVADLLAVMGEAAERGKLRDRIEAARAIARDCGVVVPKLEAEIRHGELEGLSDAELAKKLREEAAKLEAKTKGQSDGK